MRAKFCRAGCALLVIAVFLTSLSLPAMGYYNVNEYLEREIGLADAAGLVAPILMDADMDAPVTRLELCLEVMNLYTLYTGRAYAQPALNYFSDTQNEAVGAAYEMGIVSGYTDGSFCPDNPISRQELFKLMHNLMTALGRAPAVAESTAIQTINAYEDGDQVQTWATLPAYSLIQAGITNGTGAGRLDPEGLSTRSQAVVMVYRLSNYLNTAKNNGFEFEYSPAAVQNDTVIVPRDEPLDGNNNNINAAEISGEGMSAFPDETYEEKYIRIFGSMDAPKYESAEQAAENMITITIPVWNYNSAGEKVSSSRTLTIHKNIADTVLQIFTEIYQGEEQFPIYAVGGYEWRGDGTSEHNWGVAIDINPEENMMIRQGEILSGSLWEPGENVYSIPEDGDVVRAFAKYGFAWGGNAWRSNNDYMHFSYFGN